MLEDLPGFRETGCRDMYTDNIKDMELGVINMDKSTGPGSHYVCFFNSPERDHVIYFDSYGVVPPPEIRKFLRTSGKPIVYNTTQYQQIGTPTCGYFCVKLLKDLSSGLDFNDALLNFSYDVNKNEDTIVDEY